MFVKSFQLPDDGASTGYVQLRSSSLTKSSVQDVRAVRTSAESSPVRLFLLLIPVLSGTPQYGIYPDRTFIAELVETHRSASKRGSSCTKTQRPCTTRGITNSTQPNPQFAVTLRQQHISLSRSLYPTQPRPTPHHPSPCNPLYIPVHLVEHDSRPGVTITVGRDWIHRRHWGSWIRVTSTRWRCEVWGIVCIQGIHAFVCPLYAALLTAFDL